MRVPNRIKITLVVSLGFIVVGIWICDQSIEWSTDGSVYDDVVRIPHRKVGVLLGTSKYVATGRRNLYYDRRIEAAKAIYDAGKIDFIVVSGDNSQKEYNEPQTMKESLMEIGIPKERIFLDYAGFRTYDSMIRMNRIFGQTGFTVISQEFHNRRAVFIARRFGWEAIGFNARGVNPALGLKTDIREKFARVNVFTDLLFGVKPKFLGPPVRIE